MKTKSKCMIDGCEKPGRAISSSPCEMHYQRHRLTGDYGPAGHLKVAATECSIPGCDKGWIASGLCSMHRERLRRTGTTDAPNPPPCSVEHCQRDGRIGGLCQVHWWRLKQTGSVTALPPGRPNHAGYLNVSASGHILGTSMSQHRYVLFEKIGYGPHLCHWCSQPLQWKLDLECDHLNADRIDNRPENLVPSCHKCNSDRATAGRFQPGNVPANKGRRAA